MSEKIQSIQMWSCYVGDDSQRTIDSLRGELLEQEGIRIKSFATRMIGGAETVGTEDPAEAIDSEGDTTVLDATLKSSEEIKVQYVLTNGEEIHELTKTITRAKAVAVFLSPGFITSRYCCLELAGLLRRRKSLFPNFFIHCRGVEIQNKEYRNQLAGAVGGFVEAEGDYLDEAAGQFQPKPDGVSWSSWFEGLLDQRCEGIIHGYGKSTGEILSEIACYRDASVIPMLDVCNVADLYGNWIGSIQRKNLRDYLNADEPLREGNLNHKVLGTNIFTRGGLHNASIGWMVQRLGSYLEAQSAGQSKDRAREEIRSIGGFLALMLLEPTWIASLVENTNESVILHFPVKYRSGAPDPMASLYSAVAIGMVNGTVPVLKLADNAALGIKGVRGHGGVRLNELPAVPDRDGQAESRKVEQLLREFYKEVFNVPADEVPQPLEEHDLIELQGRLTGYIADGKSICYIEFDLGTYSQFTDWSAVINKALDQLNQHGDMSVNMPFVMIKRGKDAAFLTNPDAGRRFEPLRQLIDLCELRE